MGGAGGVGALPGGPALLEGAGAFAGPSCSVWRLRPAAFSSAWLRLTRGRGPASSFLKAERGTLRKSFS